MKFIDLGSQFEELGNDIKLRFDKIFKHGAFINGPEVSELEDKLKELTHSNHVVGVSNGSDAILIALLALDIGPGDEVIVPGFTFFSTGSMVTLTGAKVVFADVDPETYCITAEYIKPLITKNTKAILGVSLYGLMPDFTAINTLAKQHGITVIEDAAQSIGSVDKDGNYSGNATEVAVTSFYPTKPLGGYGEGGACFSSNEDIARKMRIVKDHGQTEKYQSEYLGINGRLNSFQAAVLLEKLKIFPQEIENRMKIAKRYHQELKGKYQAMSIEGYEKCSLAQYTIQVDNRAQVMDKLQKEGIPCAIHYPIPLYNQPIYKKRGYNLSLENCDRLAQRVISLPVHPYLSESEQEHVIKTLLNM